MENQKDNGSDNRDTLYLMGGLALMVLGAGLVLTNKSVRNVVSAGVSSVLPELQGKFGVDVSAIGDDVQRYLKLKSM
jgi:hypothetical protein